MKLIKEHLHYIYADNNKSNRDKLSTICNSVGIKCLKDEGFKFIEIYSCDGGAADEFELLDTDNPESTSRFVSSDDINEMLSEIENKMTTYNTYQEAKIANPESEVVTAGSDWSGDPALAGKFQSLVKPNEEKSNGFHIVDGTHSWVICNPADYCMTVEKFLADGYKFVNGDWFINYGELVVNVGRGTLSVAVANAKQRGDSRSYILRAAALEEKKPRTKVEYVECNESINEIAKLMIDGEAFYSKDGGGKFYWRLNAFWRSNTALSGLNGFDFHRRIETPMTWKEEIYDYLDSSCEMDGDFDDNFTIEIDGRPLSFNLSDDEFVDMCKFVASLNSVN